MTVYNINLGIGWASSGVEYAQAYRAKIFREMGQEAKFVFMDLILGDNIEHMTSKIGFSDDETAARRQTQPTLQPSVWQRLRPFYLPILSARKLLVASFVTIIHRMIW